MPRPKAAAPLLWWRGRRPRHLCSAMNRVDVVDLVVDLVDVDLDIDLVDVDLVDVDPVEIDLLGVGVCYLLHLLKLCLLLVCSR